MGDAKWSDLREPLQANGNSIGTGNGVSIDGLQVSPPRSVGSGLTLASATLAADWPIGTIAYFAVDYDAGSDDNLGFSLVDMPTAGASPIKTLEELKARLPSVGSDRTAVVAIKTRAGGAVYLKKDGVTPDDLDCLRSIGTGYRNLLIRATSTFANDVADKLIVGAIIGSAGPNGDSSWTVAAGATASVFSVAAGALPAEPGIIGMRVRFTGNVTAALVNVCGFIQQNTAAAITVGDDLSAVPAAGDTFFIETPGVTVQDIWAETLCSSQRTGVGNRPSISIVGIGLTRDMRISGSGNVAIAFTRTAMTLRAQNFEKLGFFRNYFDEVGTSRIVGGHRFAGTSSASIGRNLVLTSAAFTAANFMMADVALYSIGGNVYFGLGFQILASGFHPSPAAADTLDQSSSVGNQGASTIRRTRVVAAGGSGVVAGIGVIFSNVDIRGVDIQGAGANPAIAVVGNGQAVKIDDAVGSIGNTDVGIDVTGAKNLRLVAGVVAANTVTGTAGDIRVAGPAVTTHVGLATTNVVDNRGNDLQGTGGRVIASSVLVSNQSGGALAIGKIVRSNAVATQMTSAQADTVANARGVLGVMVTPPAAGALGYIAMTEAPWVQFDAVPTIGNLAYLSEVTAGNARDTPPPLAGTNQKLRHGYIEDVFGTLGRVIWQTEMVSILSDGVAP